MLCLGFVNALAYAYQDTAPRGESASRIAWLWERVYARHSYC